MVGNRSAVDIKFYFSMSLGWLSRECSWLSSQWSRFWFLSEALRSEMNDIWETNSLSDENSNPGPVFRCNVHGEEPDGVISIHVSLSPLLPGLRFCIYPTYKQQQWSNTPYTSCSSHIYLPVNTYICMLKKLPSPYLYLKKTKIYRHTWWLNW